MATNPVATWNNNYVLPSFAPSALAVQLLLIALAAFVLPAAAHATGLPVRTLLPMHWPVLLAGLCYGWRSGLIVGIAAPLVSFTASGMPPAPVLPAMTVELAAYGVIAGAARQIFGLNGFLSAALALIGGRIVFIATALIIGSINAPLGEYLTAAMLPGIPAAIAQLIVLPIIANWWLALNSRQGR